MRASKPLPMKQVAVSRPVGRHVLGIMRTLMELGHSAALEWNPPKVLDEMSTGDEIVYSPLLFGYSNYARAGYREHLMRFANIPVDPDGKPRGAILGGAGLAISRSCQNPAAAADYAAFVVSGRVQSGMYFDSGGQPGHRSAWLDEQTNGVPVTSSLIPYPRSIWRPCVHVTMDGLRCKTTPARFSINFSLTMAILSGHWMRWSTAYRQSLAITHQRGKA